MLLLLHRHASAHSADPARWPDDTERPLDEKGIDVEHRVARWVRKSDLVPDAILTSPWRRAAESAAILATETRAGALPARCEALAAPPDLEELRHALRRTDGARSVALVGHEPWLGELASLLLTGDPRRVKVDLPKSGVVGLEVEATLDGRTSLLFMMRPKQL